MRSGSARDRLPCPVDDGRWPGVLTPPADSPSGPLARSGGRRIRRGQTGVAASRLPMAALGVSQWSAMSRRPGCGSCRPDMGSRCPRAGDDPSSVAVAVRPGRSRPASGVRGRRLRPAAITSRSRGGTGLRVTTPARTWMDCAARLPLDYLVAMGDCDSPPTTWRAERTGGSVPLGLADGGGVVRCGTRSCCSIRRAESPGESRSDGSRHGGGLDAPRCNATSCRARVVARPSGHAWEEEMVVVEYDGSCTSTRSAASERRRATQPAAGGGLPGDRPHCRDLTHPEAMSAPTVMAGPPPP